MNIELLRAYDEANRLRELGENVPDSLTKRIKKLENNLISLDLIPRVEDLMDYILQGYESPVSLNIKYYPDTQEILVEDIVEPVLEVKNDKYKIVDDDNDTSDEVKEYLDLFMKMKRKSGALGAHKAIMLLSIFSLISNSYIRINEIVFDDTLIAHYGRMWDFFILNKDKLKKNVCIPFVHLIDEPFIRFELNEDKRSINLYRDWTVDSIQEYFKCLILDNELFRLVKKGNTRSRITTYLIDLFELNKNISFEEIKPLCLLNVAEDSKVRVTQKEGQIDNYVFFSNVVEYNQNELTKVNPSDLKGAAAIAYNNKKKKSYVIYDPTLKPLTKERLIRFLLKLMITRKLSGYRFESDDDLWIPEAINLDSIESLLKCTVFEEVDTYSGKRKNCFLIVHTSLMGFQIYTAFSSLVNKAYEGLTGNIMPEFYQEFEKFLKIIEDQTFISMSTSKWG